MLMNFPTPTALRDEKPETAPKKSLRILYADDVPELRDVAQISLTRDGHRIECVEDGVHALKQITADPTAFDVMITDHHMPNMNGMELVMRLRALRYPGKIMVFSSELSREISNAYRQLKVDRILYKPVFPAVLRQVLDELASPTPPPEVEVNPTAATITD